MPNDEAVWITGGEDERCGVVVSDVGAAFIDIGHFEPADISAPVAGGAVPWDVSHWIRI